MRCPIASSDPEDLLPDYWQNPEDLVLNFVVDRSELQVGELLTIRDVLTNVGERDRYLDITGWKRHGEELSVWHGVENPFWSRRSGAGILGVYPEPTKDGFVFLREPVDITVALMGIYPWSVPLITQNVSSESGTPVLLRANESLTENEESIRLQIPGQYLLRAQWSGRLYDSPEADSAHSERFHVTSHWVLLTVTPASDAPSATSPPDLGGNAPGR